ESSAATAVAATATAAFAAVGWVHAGVVVGEVAWVQRPDSLVRRLLVVAAVLIPLPIAADVDGLVHLVNVVLDLTPDSVGVLLGESALGRVAVVGRESATEVAGLADLTWNAVIRIDEAVKVASAHIALDAAPGPLVGALVGRDRTDALPRLVLL